MASGNLVEAHIMVNRYWFLDLTFGKGPTQSIITLLNCSSNDEMGLRGAKGIFLVRLPYHLTKYDKSCKILPHSAEFEANRNLWLSYCRFCSCLNGHPLKTHEPISVSHFHTHMAQQSGVLLTIL